MKRAAIVLSFLLVACNACTKDDSKTDKPAASASASAAVTAEGGPPCRNDATKKVDANGNLWASSRDGISIFDPSGRRLGIIRSDQVISNCVIAADGYLYMSSNVRVLRVKVNARPLRV